MLRRPGDLVDPSGSAGAAVRAGKLPGKLRPFRPVAKCASRDPSMLDDMLAVKIEQKGSHSQEPAPAGLATPPRAVHLRRITAVWTEKTSPRGE